MTLDKVYAEIYVLLKKQFEGRTDVHLVSTGVPGPIPLEIYPHYFSLNSGSRWCSERIDVCLGVNRSIRLLFKSSYSALPPELKVQAWVSPKRILRDNIIGTLDLKSYSFESKNFGNFYSIGEYSKIIDSFWKGEEKNSKCKRKIQALKPIAKEVFVVLKYYFSPSSIKFLLDLVEEELTPQ